MSQILELFLETRYVTITSIFWSLGVAEFIKNYTDPSIHSDGLTKAQFTVKRIYAGVKVGIKISICYPEPEPDITDKYRT